MISLPSVSIQLLFLILLSCALYGLFGIAPGTEAFALGFLALSAYLAGMAVSCVRLPPLVGMLLAGIFYQNVRFLPFDTHISKGLSSTLRGVSLVIILLRAGLGLDPDRLRALGLVVLGLSFVPCIVETAAVGTLSHLLLDLPWLWAFMLGFIVSAVSAAIVIPGALSLQDRQLGTERGVPTLLLASTSLDNVVALTGFVVAFNVLAAPGTPGWKLVVQRLLEPCAGLLIGGALGFILGRLPDTRCKGLPVAGYRATVLLLGGLSLAFLGKRLGVPGLGALGCVSLAFIASIRWRKDVLVQYESITRICGVLWLIIEPFLFGLVGAQVTLQSLLSNVGLGTLVIASALLVRFWSTVLALLRSSLDTRERIFVAFAWISKATVQAAVGSDALDLAKTEDKGEEFEDLGEKVLAISVLSILLTAPLGALLMDILGTRLLKNPVASEKDALESHVTVTYGTCS